jgi:secreted Zn-dependent insulinase-like peptidase
MGVEKNDPTLFTKKEKLIDSIQQIKKDDLIEFFSTKIIGAGKISVQIYSSLDESSDFTDDTIT